MAMKLLRTPRSFKIPGIGPLGELERARRRIARQERKFKRLMNEEPQRIVREQAERAATMPPPDDLQDRQRETRFYAALERGRLRNERRSQTASIPLFILLVASTIALTMWLLRAAEFQTKFMGPNQDPTGQTTLAPPQRQ